MLDGVFPIVEELTQHPEAFALRDTQFGAKATKTTEALFAYAKQTELKKTGALQELLVDGFDSEQIWEQLQLLNVPALKHIDHSVNRFLKENDDEPKRKKTKVAEQSDDEVLDMGAEEMEGSGDEVDEDEDEFGMDENDGDVGGDVEEEDDKPKSSSAASKLADEDSASGDEDTKVLQPKKITKHKEETGRAKKKAVDFFDMDEMNAFVDAAENNREPDEDEDEEDEEDEEVDLTTAVEDNGDLTKETYGDFFDQPSTFSKHVTSMKKKITRLENAAVGEKNWTMSGEVGKADRPSNSLLQEDIIFDFATKSKPVITQEHTQSLEDIIKRRIAQGTFDDVVRKNPADLESRYKAPAPLETTQNTEGLGKLYEDQFMKQAYGIEKTPQLDAAHKHVENLFQSLCITLDGLSHFHYTPQPVKVQPSEGKKNVASIVMEEKVPMVVSDATLLAPHEIHKQPITLRGEEEYTPAERKALRRRIKSKSANRHAAEANDPAKQAEAARKSKSTTGALSTLKADKKVTMLASKGNEKTGKVSSASFFRTLQNETEASKHGKPNAKPNKGADKFSKQKGFTASQLKL